MKKKVTVVAVCVACMIVVVIIVSYLMREVDLRITGLKGEVIAKSVGKDDHGEFVRLHLALEKMKKYGEKDWILTRHLEVKVRLSLDVDAIKEGEWIRVVKESEEFWHLAKK